MNRVIFLIDGFNLYHSTKDIYRDLKHRVKWLNIHSLCTSKLSSISTDASLAEVYYFSAFAYHLNDPSVIERHENYIKCLESTGIIRDMSMFKPKEIKCPLGGRFKKHEEKETDIAIAAKLIELAFHDKCDTTVLMTGDTDLTPIIETFKRLFPNKTILFAFPYRRWSRDLEVLAPGSFKIHAESYVQNCFPDPVELPDGTKIHKPPSW